jgi:transposase-like protein
LSGFPSAHWPKVWSTNPLGRVNGEVKRRTNVVGFFPNDAAIIRLLTAVLLGTDDEWAVAERATSLRNQWPRSARPPP